MTSSSNKSGRVAGTRRNASCPLVALEHGVPGLDELVLDELPHVGIVVDDEDETHDAPRSVELSRGARADTCAAARASINAAFGRAGSRIVNVLPRPGTDTTPTVPS